MHSHEAMWISLSGRWWKPNAVKVGVGELNALTGKPWHEKLAGDPQDYLVCPEQEAINGFKDGEGFFCQFKTTLTKVLMPGATLAERRTHEGLQIMVFEPRSGLFPDHPTAKPAEGTGGRPRLATARDAVVTVGQAIVPDPHGIRTWDPLNPGRVFVHIAESVAFRAITGRELSSSSVPRDASRKPGGSGL
jgi:hypothetical protein